MTFCFLIQNFAEIKQSINELWPKKRFSRCWPPPSWILKISIFGHVIVISFNIWCSVPNLIKIGRFLTEIWRFNDFQNGGCPPSWIFKNCSFCHVALVDMPFCFLIQNLAEIGQSIDELWPKKRFPRWRPPPSWILKISIFGHVTVIGSISALVYQILSKSDDFSLRYGDLAIFKMAAIRHVGFVMTSQYCTARYIFVVQILSWNFLSIGVVVSEILAIS